MGGFSWKPFGYEGKPGTCLWCGARLYRKMVLDRTIDKPYPENMVRATQAGPYQDDHFCTLSCGYLFGERQAQLGSRLKA